jgi:hypothetical protein
MSTTTTAASPNTLNTRVLQEGYGAEAWHGPNLKAALADVSPELASWRPAAGRHNIAEIAIHHAYYAHSVRGRLSETAPEPFVLDGEDWFTLSGPSALSWKDVLAVVDTQQQRLATLVGDIDAGRVASKLPDAERFALVLGIACHAVYHAGQVQLIKKLHARD